MVNHDWFGLHKMLSVGAMMIMMWMFKVDLCHRECERHKLSDNLMIQFEN
ncbi:hypothetical protein WN51_09845 [Melipona quadrifasciata]|uniref:Uncharacterized protein n=1 Tax=Melipona quadrifasciata TaxID=166423 RepID=A0A0N0U6C5_9HYME|nr:hypothetical protein WN51_09845 [Melipona quadrifasciata]